MMTKYQLVFVRLDTVYSKILQNTEAQKRLRLKRGFQAFRTHAFEASVVNRSLKKRQLVCLKLELSLSKMLGAF